MLLDRYVAQHSRLRRWRRVRRKPDRKDRRIRYASGHRPVRWQDRNDRRTLSALTRCPRARNGLSCPSCGLLRQPNRASHHNAWDHHSPCWLVRQNLFNRLLWWDNRSWDRYALSTPTFFQFNDALRPGQNRRHLRRLWWSRKMRGR